MKKQDIEKLKEICEREGFELKRIEYQTDRFEVSKKDSWDGVEFARYVYKDGENFTNGRIYKIREGKSIHDDLAFLDESGKPNGYCPSNTWKFQPATEQEYVDQLISEAKELFGEIKEGDRFIDPEGDEIVMDEITEDFRYEKYSDFLYFNDWVIYESGKWAERVEKCEVKVHNCYVNSDNNRVAFSFILSDITKMESEELPIQVTTYLAQQLENYLNE